MFFQELTALGFDFVRCYVKIRTLVYGLKEVGEIITLAQKTVSSGAFISFCTLNSEL